VTFLPVPAGRFVMGSDRHYPEERPAHDAEVAAFLLARAPVTNAEFAAFVRATDYVTVAERAPDPALYPGVPPERLVPGSAVFAPPSHPVDLADTLQWWAYVPGASWRDHAHRTEHPVVHVALADAEAYAAWAGARLPSEVEWERAAAGATVEHANVWEGEFPWRSTRPGGAGTTPVGTYAPNPLGLVDMVGNVWEWTATAWGAHLAPPPAPCCAPGDPAAPAIALRVAKGGSYLCAASYCARYRPAARMAMAEDSGASNLGFRVAR
jgi:formylglycine-generating enzyme required for sulfatase activity